LLLIDERGDDHPALCEPFLALPTNLMDYIIFRMDLQLQGRRAIVTGGSRGIGKVIARELAFAGVAVVITGRHQPTLDSAARELTAATRTGRGRRHFRP
jgi:hypothetical protein